MTLLNADKNLIPVIQADCKYWLEKKRVAADFDFHDFCFDLYLHEYEDSENTGLYGLFMQNTFSGVERELCYGTLREINAVVKAMCRMADWGL